MAWISYRNLSLGSGYSSTFASFYILRNFYLVKIKMYGENLVTQNRVNIYFERTGYKFCSRNTPNTMIGIYD